MIRTVDYQAADAEANFCVSIAESGFAVLQNHPLCLDRLRRMYSGWLDFFRSDEKFNFTVADRTADDDQFGYFAPEVAETAIGHDQQDLKEYFHASHGHQLPVALEADVIAHQRAAEALAAKLLDWLDAAMPEDRCQSDGVVLSSAVTPAASLLRILHYPPLSGAEPAGSVRAAAHEDINFITLLPVSDQPGLQVRTRDGDWLDLEGRSGDLIINTGDMLQELSGGYFPSTTHRVVNPSDDSANVSRISIPYFLHPDENTRLSPRYTAGEYLSERIRANYAG